MGVRSAVIAVATAMQESDAGEHQLRRPGLAGPVPAAPVDAAGARRRRSPRPSYAADAFLSALHTHQKADPGWASQPLWATAQAVQKSGFPYAYAKWEAQAAQLVQRVASHLG